MWRSTPYRWLSKGEGQLCESDLSVNEDDLKWMWRSILFHEDAWLSEDEGQLHKSDWSVIPSVLASRTGDVYIRAQATLEAANDNKLLLLAFYCITSIHRPVARLLLLGGQDKNISSILSYFF